MHERKLLLLNTTIHHIMLNYKKALESSRAFLN